MCTYVPAQLCSCKAVQSSHSDILSISRVISVPAGGAKYGMMRLLELPFLLAKRPQQTDLATRREHLVYGNKSGKNRSRPMSTSILVLAVSFARVYGQNAGRGRRSSVEILAGVSPRAGSVTGAIQRVCYS